MNFNKWGGGGGGDYEMKAGGGRFENRKISRSNACFRWFKMVQRLDKSVPHPVDERIVMIGTNMCIYIPSDEVPALSNSIFWP